MLADIFHIFSKYLKKMLFGHFLQIFILIVVCCRRGAGAGSGSQRYFEQRVMKKEEIV
jgi:hypothetical protein